MHLVGMPPNGAFLVTPNCKEIPWWTLNPLERLHISHLEIHHKELEICRNATRTMYWISGRGWMDRWKKYSKQKEKGFLGGTTLEFQKQALL